MIAILKNLFKKPDPQYIVQLKIMLSELRDHRIGLVIQHAKIADPLFAIVSRYDPKSKRIILLDLSPDDFIHPWKKNEILRISSTPKMGKYFIFEVIINSTPTRQSHYYEAHFPEDFQTFDIRKYPRISLDKNSIINVNLAVATNSTNDKFLNSIVPNVCGYEGILFDVSLGGMQVIFQDDCRDVFKKENIVKADLTYSMDIAFSGHFAIKWVFYDRIENVTRLGGAFTDLTADENNKLISVMSSIQAAYYHRYA